MATQSVPAVACPMGVDCRQTGLLHFADFYHPIIGSNGGLKRCGTGDDFQTEATSSAPSPAADAAGCEQAAGQLKRQDTMPIEEFIEAKRRRTDAGSDGSATEPELQAEHPPTRGLSLLRQFSAMSHAERKALVADALAARQSLERRLRRAESRERRLSDRLCTGLPALPEELDALREGRCVLLPLAPDPRLFRPDSAQEVHYRIAEAQFHRLLAKDCVGSFQVTKVEYVVNPTLLRQFRQFQAGLLAAVPTDLAESDCEPVLAFHGTEDVNIESICASGFRVPGVDDNYAQASDTGWYGRGIYFSEFPACAMDYVRGRRRLLLCMVLPGRSFHCPSYRHGQPPQPGCHSHRSPDGRELVTFSAAQALPTYVVHYESCLATTVSTDAVVSAGGGPHDHLHSLYFQASELRTQILAGRTVRIVDPAGELTSSGGMLLLTWDQVTRFCLAQGACRVIGKAEDEDSEADAPDSDCLVVIGLRENSAARAGRVEFMTLAELLGKCLYTEKANAACSLDCDSANINKNIRLTS